jgi:mycofactocin system glycosyltransferase
MGFWNPENHKQMIPGKELQKDKPLAYRLRKEIKCYAKDNRFILVLNYPLKVIVLDHSWKPLFDTLSKDEFVAFESLASLFNQVTVEKLELFLNQLTRKGFLEQEGFAKLADYPSVSVVIPVRNRPEEIAACLSSLGQLDYPSEKIEIIVVDDASSDNTPAAVSDFPVKLISLQQHRQASFCRNLAAQKAQGDILAFIDSDCLADPLWLKELVPAFRIDTLGAVGGMVDSFFNEKGLDRYEKVRSSLNMGSWFRSSEEGGNFFYVPSCNLLVRRDLFLRMGGFKEELHVGEDVDLCWRIQDQGCHVEYRPMGRVYHKHRNRLGTFCSRRFDYGTSEPLLQRLHKKRIKLMTFPPSESLFWGLLAVSALFQSLPVFCLGGMLLFVNSLIAFNKIRRKGIPITFFRLFLAVSRGHLAFLAHFCSFVSRYYLIWSFFIFPLFPSVTAIVMSAHFLTGITEFFIRKPHLSILPFLGYFSLEQLSYQSGVWWGCIKNLCFRPVNPVLVTKAPL